MGPSYSQIQFELWDISVVVDSCHEDGVKCSVAVQHPNFATPRFCMQDMIENLGFYSRASLDSERETQQTGTSIHATLNQQIGCLMPYAA